MAQICRVGEPANASESKAIRRLAEELPESYLVIHNFELTTGRGLPYEFDIVVVADTAVWHVEVKGYRGLIRGDRHSWVFENGHVQPSPIPLANNKTRVLAARLKEALPNARLYVDTAILLTDSRARAQIRDEQARRVIRLPDAAALFTDSSSGSDLRPHRDAIRQALYDGGRPGQPVRQIGLYDVLERINQTDTRTVFLAQHRHIQTRPQTILKVFHFDIYASEVEKERQIKAIFQDQNAMRILGSHRNLIQTGDMFAWEDNKFVLPTEYIESGRPLLSLLEQEEETEISGHEKADWISKLACGLRHAHRNGVIHRDIQPLNVVVAPDGTCKIVNFDLALIADAQELNQTRQRALRRRFHPSFVAPEVWRDPRVGDPRSDIYSLGILFYRLLTGKVPYDDIEAHLQDSGPTPLELDLLREKIQVQWEERSPRTADDLVSVIERMTQRAPTQRYADMDGVMDDLAILEA